MYRTLLVSLFIPSFIPVVIIIMCCVNQKVFSIGKCIFVFWIMHIYNLVVVEHIMHDARLKI